MNRFLLALASLTTASSAWAQSPQLLAAMASGQVGERYDGYLGFAAPPSDLLRRQVIAVNIKRRNLYTQLAVERNVNVELVGITTGCSLLMELPVGAAYMLDDKLWRRRAAGEPAPRPKECR